MDKLKKYFRNYYILNDISGILFWDNATNLPTNSISSRTEQMSILSHYTDKIFRESEVLEELSKSKNLKLSELDHKNLNLDVPAFKNLNPSAENIAMVIYNWLKPHFSSGIDLKIRLYETPRNYVDFGDD